MAGRGPASVPVLCNVAGPGAGRAFAALSCFQLHLPSFAHPLSNAVLEWNTPAVGPKEVTPAIVYVKASRKRKLEQAVEDGISIGGAPLVSQAEAGLASIRLANAINLAAGDLVAPPWFDIAMRNLSVARANERVRMHLKFQLLGFDNPLF